MSLEGNTTKKTKKSRAGRPLKKIDYRRVAYWASRMVSQKIIAEKIGFSPEGLCRRKKRDLRLRRALDRSIDGQIALHIQMFEKAIEHLICYCLDCHKTTDIEFFSHCQFCGSSRVQHEYKPGNTRLLIYLGKRVRANQPALIRELSPPIG